MLFSHLNLFFTRLFYYNTFKIFYFSWNSGNLRSRLITSHFQLFFIFLKRNGNLNIQNLSSKHPILKIFVCFFAKGKGVFISFLCSNDPVIYHEPVPLNLAGFQHLNINLLLLLPLYLPKGLFEFSLALR